MAFRELTISASGVRYFHGVPRLDHFGHKRPLLPWRAARGMQFFWADGAPMLSNDFFLDFNIVLLPHINYGCSLFSPPVVPCIFRSQITGMQSFFSPPSSPAFSVRKLRGCSLFFRPRRPRHFPSANYGDAIFFLPPVVPFIFLPQITGMQSFCSPPVVPFIFPP